MDVAQEIVARRKRVLDEEVEDETTEATEREEVAGGDGEAELCSSSSCLVQVKRRREVTENSGEVKDDQCWSPGSDEFAASYCSSTEVVGDDELKFPDLEEESVEIKSLTSDLNCRERREMTPLSELGEETGQLDSNSKMPAANSRRRSTPEKMPSDAQLEEFFAAAEKKIQKEFTEKYNFDIVKDKPLKGRYEWAPLKP